jgi:membrane-bound lytic murein transglycosylase B
MIRFVSISLLVLGLSAPVAVAQSLPTGGAESFPACMAALKRDAVASGISRPIVDQATAGIGWNARVIELDRAQPEFFQTFWRYFETRISDQRVQKGRELLTTHRDLLARVEAQYGVPARYLVSFWGMESNFGQFTGGFRVFESLATLACDPRRSDFFKAELFAAFRILAEGAIPPPKMLGSWAGAMGQTQFMPSTFMRYALDYDGDGKRDLWTSLPDIFGSSARYLSTIGWKREQEWGREVKLAAWFAWDQADLDVKKSAAEWRAAGVTEADGSPLRDDGLRGSVVLPGGWRGPAFLVFDNFRVILAWNRSLSYAVAVGHLADRYAGKGPLVAVKPADDEPMPRDQVLDMQNRLVSLGYDVGNADGVVGAKTRVAAKAFQKRTGLPADGYPSQDLLRAVRQATGG